VWDDAVALAAEGWTYWSPGPAAGTAWVLDADGAATVTNVDGRTKQTPVQRKRCDRSRQLVDAVATAGHSIRYRDGAYADAVVVPIVEGQRIVPFNPDEQIHTYRQYR
jgi:hypothetical protein